MKNPLLVALIGRTGSGKDTMAEYLLRLAKAKFGGEPVIVSSSEFLGDSLSSWGIESTTENRQKYVQILENAWGTGILSKALRIRIRKLLDEKQFVIFNCIRLPSDMTMIEELGGLTVHIVCKDERRCYERVRIRKTGSKPGDNKLTFDQFLEQCKAPTEVHIDSLGERALWKIPNYEGLSDFYSEVEEFFISHYP